MRILTCKLKIKTLCFPCKVYHAPDRTTLEHVTHVNIHTSLGTLKMDLPMRQHFVFSQDCRELGKEKVIMEEMLVLSTFETFIDILSFFFYLF